MDIYVANDKTRNFLFRNNGDLTFSDVSYFSLTGFNAAGEAEAGMGTDFGDFDGDGLLDLMSSRTTTWRPMASIGTWAKRPSAMIAGSKALPKPASGCSDSEPVSSITTTTETWTCLSPTAMFWMTFPVIGTTFRIPNPINYWKTGAGAFTMSQRTRVRPCGRTRVSRGTAFGDYDNDGDIDLVVTNIDDSPELLVNQSYAPRKLDFAPLGGAVQQPERDRIQSSSRGR